MTDSTTAGDVEIVGQDAPAGDAPLLEICNLT